MPRENLLISGSTGRLGAVLAEVLSADYEVISTSSVDFDISNLEATRAFIHRKCPDVVIHSAAFLSVDDCEDQPNRAFRINALGARNMAVATRETEAKICYISTDCCCGNYIIHN